VASLSDWCLIRPCNQMDAGTLGPARPAYVSGGQFRQGLEGHQIEARVAGRHTGAGAYDSR